MRNKSATDPPLGRFDHDYFQYILQALLQENLFFIKSIIREYNDSFSDDKIKILGGNKKLGQLIDS